MDAGMSASARGRNGASAGKSLNHTRGLDQSAFIDVSLETPINQPQQQQQQQQQFRGYPAPIMQNGLPQTQNFRGYPPGFNGPSNGGSPMYMNPQMSTSMNGFVGNGPQMMYMHPNSSSMVSVPQGMGMGMPMGGYNGNNVGSYQQAARNKQRRNSNASMSTMSVNRFMKKQWSRVGGGGGDDGDGDDGDGDDAKIEIDTSENEISFEDLQHIRGDRPGFGLTDSTPYIPTLKVSTQGGSKVTGEQHRKIQMAHKKAFAMNLARQNKQQQQQPQQQPPRSMSLQTYGNAGYAPNYGGGYPGTMAPMGTVGPMGPMNPMMMPPPPSQQQHPSLPPNQQNGTMMLPVQTGMMTPSMTGGSTYANNANTGHHPVQMNQPPFNPRSMSLQSDSGMRQRPFQVANNGANAWGPMMRSQTPNRAYPNGTAANSPTLNPAAVGRTPPSFSPRLNPTGKPNGGNNGEILQNVQEETGVESQPEQAPAAATSTTAITKSKKNKVLSKIEFSPVSEGDKDDMENGVSEQVKQIKSGINDNENSPIKETVLPTLPTVPPASSNGSRVTTPTRETGTPLRRREKGHQVTRSGVGSVVSFDSLTQKDQKAMQDKLYHLRNNSSQKTIFYSAAEFQPIASSDSLARQREDDSVNMKKQLSVQNEEPELSTSTALDDVHEGVEEPNATATDSIATTGAVAPPNVNIDEINDSLDEMVLKTSPVVNHNAFGGNYGSYGDNLRNSTTSYKSVEATQPLHLNLKENNKNANLNPNTRDTYSSLSPAKTDSSGNLVDMSLSLNSQSKESSPLKSTSIRKDILTKKAEFPNKREFTPPPSALGLTTDSITAATSIKSTPSKIRSSDSEPRTPISIASPSHTSFFTPEQYGLLNDNTQLLQELELVTTELASSVSREIALEGDLRKRSKSMSRGNSSVGKKQDSDCNEPDLTVTDTGDNETSKGSAKNDSEIEIDAQSKTPSQYAATITSLTKQLNEERKKRYLIEGILLKFQESPGGAEFQDDLLDEKKKVSQLTDQLNNIKESVNLHKTEKDLLEVENTALKLEIEELQRKYGNMEREVVPRLKNQVEMLEEMINSSKHVGGSFSSP